MADLAALRQKRTEQRLKTGNVQMDVAKGKSSGAIVIDAKNISKSYGEKRIIADFSTRVMRGDRIGIIGPNGAGKTTLVKLLTGELSPDNGEIKFGSNIELGLLDQQRSTLSPKMSLKDALTGGGSDMVVINEKSRHVISYMKDFLFVAEQAGTALEKLSGGERARVALAKVLSLPSNLLVLDEPTNDLDLETLDLLQEMIADYHGTAIIVSHDRDFLDRVASSIIAFEGNGKWLEYAGGYSDYEAQAGAAAIRGSNPKKPAKQRAPKADIAKTVKQKKKLSFNQQHALRILPGKIEILNEKIARLQQKLDDPKFYTSDPEGFTRISKELNSLSEMLAEKEEKWLELEMEREELES